MRSIVSATVLFAFVLGLAADSAHAHGVWVAKRHDKYCVGYGEGRSDNAYPVAKVEKVAGYDANHRPVEVAVLPQDGHVRLEPAEGAAVIAVFFNNGYWSKDADGKYVNKPMNEVPGAESASLTLKNNVTYLAAAAAPLVVGDFALQIVPSVNPAGLRMGDRLEVTVLKDGKPLAGAPVIADIVNDLENTVETGPDGKAVVTVRNGALNIVGVEMDFPIADADGKATRESYFTTISFVAAK